MFFHKSQHEAKSHYHMLIFCSVIQSLHRPFTSPKKPGGWLTELGWLWTLLPSVSSSLSLLSRPLLCSLSLPQLRGCAHRLDTANRDAARAQRSLKNGITTRTVDLSVPFPPVLSASFPRFSAMPSLTELPGEWRWVFAPDVLRGALKSSEFRWLGRALSCWMGSPIPRLSTRRRRSAAQRRRLPLSAAYKSCIKESGERE